MHWSWRSARTSRTSRDKGTTLYHIWSCTRLNAHCVKAFWPFIKLHVCYFLTGLSWTKRPSWISWRRRRNCTTMLLIYITMKYSHKSTLQKIAVRITWVNIPKWPSYFFFFLRKNHCVAGREGATGSEWNPRTSRLPWEKRCKGSGGLFQYILHVTKKKTYLF